jgi:hypothetical protein
LTFLNQNKNHKKAVKEKTKKRKETTTEKEKQNGPTRPAHTACGNGRLGRNIYLLTAQ